MDALSPSQNQAVETFITITGSSRSLALQKLQSHGWNLNAAIDEFFNDEENSSLQRRMDGTCRSDWREEDELLHHAGPIHTLIPQPASPNLSSWGNPNTEMFRRSGIGRLSTTQFPARSPAPVISHPREVREIPIDWRDDEKSTRSYSGLVIEEVPLTKADISIPESQGHIIVENDDDVPSTTSPTFRGSIEKTDRNTDYGSIDSVNRSSVPFAESPAFGDGGHDFEEEMLLAAIEASKKEAETANRRANYSEAVQAEDDDLAIAVSLSIQTAEQERALREQRDDILQQEVVQEDYNSKDTLPEDRNFGSFKRNVETCPSENTKRDKEMQYKAINSSEVNVERRESSSSTAPNMAVQEIHEAEEQPLLRKRFAPRLGTTANLQGSVPDLVRQEFDNLQHESSRVSNPYQETGDTLRNDERGGVSFEEHEEAVMYEAMFGTLPENAQMGFEYPPVPSNSDACLPDVPQGYGHSVQLPSPSIVAQRKQQIPLATKNLALPPEPDMEDDNAVTLLVRMPDGSRRGRRFRKSEKLQCLFDFIDVGGGVRPGSYRLVRQYPRKTFTADESRLSFSELCLDSKLEALFLELI